MIKAFRKYFLFLLIFLLPGFGWLHANFAQNNYRNSHAPGTDSPMQAVTAHSCTLTAWFTLLWQDRITGIGAKKSEEENDNLTFLKAYTDHGTHFAALFRQVTLSTHYSAKIGLSSCRHWFFSSSHRYNILQVFRL
jgi:hypothetical protein